MGVEFLGEFLGTLVLVLLGNGIVAGNLLSKTKSNGAGWLSITIGWGIAVTIGAFVSGYMSPAHLNPAVTIAFAINGSLAWGISFTLHRSSNAWSIRWFCSCLATIQISL